MLIAIFAPLLAPYGFNQLRDATASRSARSSRPAASTCSGTTVGGYDVLSRVIWGAQTALVVIIVAVLLSIFAGVPLGLVSGYLGGWLDRVLVVIADAIYAFPSLLLAIVVVDRDLRRPVELVGAASSPRRSRSPSCSSRSTSG